MRMEEKLSFYMPTNNLGYIINDIDTQTGLKTRIVLFQKTFNKIKNKFYFIYNKDGLKYNNIIIILTIIASDCSEIIQKLIIFSYSKYLTIQCTTDTRDMHISQEPYICNCAQKLFVKHIWIFLYNKCQSGFENKDFCF